MKIGLRRLVLLLVGAQIAALSLYLALAEAADVAGAPRPRTRRSGSVPPPRDPRVTVGWEGAA